MDNVAGFFVYNPTLGHEFSEGEKILAFYPDIDFNYQKQYVGLSEGLIGFASSFTQVAMLDYIQTNRYHFCVYSPEHNYFIVILANKDENDDENDTTKKEILELSLKRFYNLFKLSNGTFASVAKRQSYNGLRDRLSLLLSYYLRIIPLASTIIPLTHGLQYLPIDKTTFLTLKYFVASLSTNFPFSRIVSIFYHDSVVYTSVSADETVTLLLLLRYPILLHYIRENGLLQSRNEHKTEQFLSIHKIVDTYLPQSSLKKTKGGGNMKPLLAQGPANHHDKENEKTKCICLDPIPDQLLTRHSDISSTTDQVSLDASDDLFELEYIPESEPESSIPHHNDNNDDDNDDDIGTLPHDDPPLLGVERNTMRTKRNHITTFHHPKGYATACFPSPDLVHMYRKTRQRRLSSIFSELMSVADSPVYDDEEDDDSSDEPSADELPNTRVNQGEPTGSTASTQDPQTKSDGNSSSSSSSKGSSATDSTAYWTPPVYFSQQDHFLRTNTPGTSGEDAAVDAVTNPYKPTPSYSSNQPNSPQELEQRQLLHHKYILKRLVAQIHGITLPEDTYDEYLLAKQKRLKSESKTKQEMNQKQYDVLQDELRIGIDPALNIREKAAYLSTHLEGVKSLLEYDYTIECEHYKEYLSTQEYLAQYYHENSTIFLAIRLSPTDIQNAMTQYEQQLQARQSTLLAALSAVIDNCFTIPPARLRTRALCALSNYLDHPGVFYLIPTPDNPIDEVDVLFNRVLDTYIEEQTQARRATATADTNQDQKKTKEKSNLHDNSQTSSLDDNDIPDANDHDHDTITPLYEPTEKEVDQLRRQLYDEIRSTRYLHHQQQMYNHVLSTTEIKPSLYTSIFNFLSVNMVKIAYLFNTAQSASTGSKSPHGDAAGSGRGTEHDPRYPASPGSGQSPVSPTSSTLLGRTGPGPSVLPYLYYNATNNAVSSTLHPNYLTNTLYSTLSRAQESAIGNHHDELQNTQYPSILQSNHDIIHILNHHYMLQNSSMASHISSHTFDGAINRPWGARRYNRQFYDDVVIHYPIHTSNTHLPLYSTANHQQRRDLVKTSSSGHVSGGTQSYSQSIHSTGQLQASSSYMVGYSSPLVPASGLLQDQSTQQENAAHAGQGHGANKTSSSTSQQRKPPTPTLGVDHAQQRQQQQQQQGEGATTQDSQSSQDKGGNLWDIAASSGMTGPGSRRRTAIDLGTTFPSSSSSSSSSLLSSSSSSLSSSPSMPLQQQQQTQQQQDHDALAAGDSYLAQSLLTLSISNVSDVSGGEHGQRSGAGGTGTSATSPALSPPPATLQQQQQRELFNHFNNPIVTIPSIVSSIPENESLHPPSSSTATTMSSSLASLESLSPSTIGGSALTSSSSQTTIPIYDWSLLTVENVDTIHSSIAIKGLLLSYFHAKRESVLIALHQHQRSEKEKLSALLSPRAGSQQQQQFGGDQVEEIVNTNDFDITQLYTQDELNVDFSWLLSSNNPVSLFSIMSTPTTVLAMANAVHTQRQISIIIPNVFQQQMNMNNYTISPTQMTGSTQQCVTIPLDVITPHTPSIASPSSLSSSSFQSSSRGRPPTSASDAVAASSSFLTSLLSSASPLLLSTLSSTTMPDLVSVSHSTEPLVSSSFSTMAPATAMINPTVQPSSILLPNLIDISTIVNAMQKSTFQRIFSF